MAAFTSVLVANRGEIALRVMRTARAQGYRTIAVYSEADAHAPHVQFADDAVCIGPAPVGESYLAAEKILDAAKQSGAQAIHPGYGFLSENAAFAQAVEDAGLVFVGPTAASIDLMGNKAAAKRHMIAANVPCVPGYEGEDQSDSVFAQHAERIGYPIMVKAAAGGGGRGMRLVHAAEDLQNALDTARSEAKNAFGSDELILEKAIIQPRHVEVQVFSDTHGNHIHLGERDCSVQRRHQKVVEEAPCPVMTPDLRERMGTAAVDAAASINYRGAGTVEFLLDASGDFYFLEMNTRLQVEHPVTELVTGLDLVALQLKVAQGDALGIHQNDVTLTGHAIEVRLYAEDPAQDFLPQTGNVLLWNPADGDGVRIDAGIETGSEISPFYDPMIAKVIAYGADRAQANTRLIEALKQTQLFGSTTNKSFLIDVLSRAAFQNGAATTAFIGEEFTDADLARPAVSHAVAGIAALLLQEHQRSASQASGLGVHDELMNWSSLGHLESHYRFVDGDIQLDVHLSTSQPQQYTVRIGDCHHTLALQSLDSHHVQVMVDGRRVRASYAVEGAVKVHLELDGMQFVMADLLAAANAGEDEAGGGRVIAPMHGTLLEIVVAAGDTVAKGDKLAVLEAMKMQHDIVAAIDGTIEEIAAQAGKQIAADDLILTIEPTE